MNQRTPTDGHSHVFGQDHKRPGESRTLLVVVITATMMVVEVAAGILYGSMALLADGLHMASHAAALGIAVLAYVVSRRLAADQRFSFGVGKINSLAGYTSAVLLMGFALLMASESIQRLISPRDIAFDSALVVAVLGFAVNGACAWILVRSPGGHDHGHHHDHDHHHHDHNLRAAYLHVLADALTSVLAIVALLAGKYLDAAFTYAGTPSPISVTVHNGRRRLGLWPLPRAVRYAVAVASLAARRAGPPAERRPRPRESRRSRR